MVLWFCKEKDHFLQKGPLIFIRFLKNKFLSNFFVSSQTKHQLKLTILQFENIDFILSDGFQTENIIFKKVTDFVNDWSLT